VRVTAKERAVSFHTKTDSIDILVHSHSPLAKADVRISEMFEVSSAVLYGSRLD